MAATIEIPKEMDDVVTQVIENVDDEIGIRLNKKTLIPMVFCNADEVTNIVLREIRTRIEMNRFVRV